MKRRIGPSARAVRAALAASKALAALCLATTVAAADAAPPQRIVSLLPSLTETLCELQACSRLVGVDRFSNWPDSVRALPKLGGLDDVVVERVVTLKPDLVLAAVSTRAVDRLEALGLTVVALEPRSLADAQSVYARLAQVLGRPEAAEPAWQRLRQRIAQAAARVPAALRGKRVYFEVASVPYAAGEASFIGEMLASLGLANIVPARLGPFPQLNPEFVLRAEPDLVMATTQALGEMAARPGWAAMPALAQGQACGFGPAVFDLLMRPGPRLGEAAEAVVECLLRLPSRH